MNWITNYVRPKIRALVGQPEIPDNLWIKCPSCSMMIFRRDLEKTMHLCQHCGHHLRLDAKKRLEMLFDDGRYDLRPAPKVPTDPLKFRDLKRYSDRLRDAQAKVGHSNDALLIAHGTLGGMGVVMAAFDFSFMGGSMGIAVGEAFLTAARLAVEKQTPLIVIPASGGARMQEGILSLMQMPRTTIAVAEVREAGLPYLVLLTDPTTGGVSASFAMLGDIAVAEPGAMIGFAGQRVIEETIREQLPEGFQRAEYLRDHGMVDMVVPRTELRDTLIRLLGLLHTKTPPEPGTTLPAPEAEPDDTETESVEVDAESAQAEATVVEVDVVPESGPAAEAEAEVAPEAAPEGDGAAPAAEASREDSADAAPGPETETEASKNQPDSGEPKPQGSGSAS